MIIRIASVDDVPQIAKTHVQSWKTTYIGQVPQSYLDELSIPKRVIAWTEALSRADHRMFVAEINGAIVGFSSFGPSRDEDASPNTGELYAIYLTEENQGLGIGTSLWNQTFQALKEFRYAEMTLWVLDTNKRARNFYGRVGFTNDGKEKIVNIGGKDVTELRYRMYTV
jgi:ribosomal protein S18 acetylase RimI-like enzyme